MFRIHLGLVVSSHCSVPGCQKWFLYLLNSLCMSCISLESILAASCDRFRESQRFGDLGNLRVGQRVVYGKVSGRIPLGSTGTVVGTYSDFKTKEQMVEVLLDYSCLGE